MATANLSAQAAEGNPETNGYRCQGGEFVSFEDAHQRMSDLEDVANGILMFCEAVLKDARNITYEEGSELAFIRLGAKELVSGICDMTPDRR